MNRAMLEIDHADYSIADNHGRGQEGLESVLRKIAEKLEPRIMVGFAANGEQAPLPSDPTGESFVEAEPDLANGIGVGSFGGAEDELALRDQVEKAGVGMGKFGDLSDHGLERIPERDWADQKPVELLVEPELTLGVFQAGFQFLGFGHASIIAELWEGGGIYYDGTNKERTMWNRRKEDEIPKPAMSPPTNATLAREGIPMNTLPPRPPEHERDRPASIGKSVIIKGQLFSREDLFIDGEIEGSVEMQEHKLTVGPNGKLQAGVKAREIVVLGTIHGNVEAGEKIEIRKDAKLVGDIKTTRIVIEDGAYFKGSIDITRPEPKAKAAAATVAAAVPSSPIPAPEVKR